MAAVPQKTLNWLWDVLRREYRDPQRAYSDVVQALSLYPGFAPRTDVYTSETGAPALLLHLNGTVPVNFRGTQYQFPIIIWMPHAYPHQPPIVYVTPTGDMVVRPGQHVSGSDGRIYHPYLARWQEARERSTVADLLKLLGDIFAREPPVMSRQNMPLQPPQGSQQTQQPQQLPPRPPPPNEQRSTSARPPSAIAPVSVPPPPPPKGTDGTNGIGLPSTASPDIRRHSRYDAPPPLPGYRPPSRPTSIVSLPPTNYGPQPQPQRQIDTRPSHFAQQQQPSSEFQQPGQPPISFPVPQYNQQNQIPPQARAPQQQQAPYLQQQYLPQPNRQSYPPPQHSQSQFRPAIEQPRIVKPKAQEPNLMDESPFEISLASPSTNLPTPRIPPNPEKQHLLDTLSSSLLQNLHQQITQSSSALPALSSQHSALLAAQQTLQSELTQLKTLQSQLASNISSLNTTLSSADRVISTAKKEKDGNGVPSVDECVIPPTVVARQLYDAVAEQRGYEAAIFALTEAFVRGRIGSKVWERKTRECAREEFRRKWLVKKRLAWGLGLETGVLEA